MAVRFSFVAGILATVLVSGCDSSSPSANGGSTASAPTTASAEPLVPEVLQGHWRRVPRSAGRVTLIVRETEYSLRGPYRLTAGLLGDEEVLEFFTGDFTDCESDDPWRYRWTLEGDILSLAAIGKDPCRGRRRVLDGSTFERRG